MLLNRPRVVVRYPNTNSFLIGTIIKDFNEKKVVKCDRGCTIIFNNGSRNIIGATGKEVNTQVLSKTEAIESILKNLKPFTGNPLKKAKYEKGDRIVLIHEGGGNYAATIKHVSNTYTVAWDNTKYPDEEVDHESVIGLAIDKKRSNQIPNKLLKEFLVQSGSKQIIKEENLKLGKTNIEIPLSIVNNEINEDEYSEVTNKSDDIIKELNSFRKKKVDQPSKKDKIIKLQEQIKETLDLLNSLNKELSELILEKEEQVEVKPVEKVEKPIKEKVVKQKEEVKEEPIKLEKTKLHEIPKSIPRDEMDEEDEIIEQPVITNKTKEETVKLSKIKEKNRRKLEDD